LFFLLILDTKLLMNSDIQKVAHNIEFFGRLYQIPLLRVYRKHDRSLQGLTTWIKQQVTSPVRLKS
ncbi:hypothetical protein L9F63_003855, partial [Diploptera punctata]